MTLQNADIDLTISNNTKEGKRKRSMRKIAKQKHIHTCEKFSRI